MTIPSKTPLKKPVLDNVVGKVSDTLKGMQKDIEKPIEDTVKIASKLGNFIGKLNKKYLAPLVAPILNFFSDFKLKPEEKNEDFDKALDAAKKDKTPAKQPVKQEAVKKEDVEKKEKDEETQAKLDELMGEIKPKAEAFNQGLIRSHPFERGKPRPPKYPEGITLCSKTAFLNLRMLAPGKTFISIRDKPDTKADIQKVREAVAAGKYNLKDIIPTGNADDVQQYYYALRKPDTISGVTPNDFINSLNETGKTVCDITTYGGTKYDHRSAGFKGIDGNWYVLDPYRPGKDEESPVLLSDYAKRVDIAFIVPIDTSKNPSGATEYRAT